MRLRIGISGWRQRSSARSSYAISQRATPRSTRTIRCWGLRAEARRRCAGAVLVRGADADAMPASNRVDAWCTQRGRRSQRSSFAHSKPASARGRRLRTDRRCRSADAGLGATSLIATGSADIPCGTSLRLARRVPSAHWVGVRSTEDDGSSVGRAPHAVTARGGGARRAPAR